MKSIRSKIIVLFSILIFIIMVAVGALSYYTTSKLVRSDFEKASQGTIKLVNSSINDYFKNAEESINLMAGEPSLTGLSGTYNEAEIKRLLIANQKNHPNFSMAYVALPNKKMILSADVTLPADFDPTTRPWYTSASSSDKLVWTEAYVDATSGSLVISGAKSIKVNGKVVGVVGVDLDMTKLAEHVTSTKLGESGYLALISPKGIILVHPKPEMVGTDVSAEGFIQTVIEKKQGFIQYNYKGTEKFASFEYNEMMNWHLMGTMNASELSDKVNPIGIIIAVASLVGVTLMVVFGFFIANSITNPIRQIVSAMHKAENGDLTARVSIKQKDETGRLGESFNGMLANIAGLVDKVSSSAHHINEASEKLSKVAWDTAEVTKEVSSTVSEIARGAEDQASEAQTGASQINELSSQIGEIAHNTEQVLEASKNAANKNTVGQQAMKTLKLKTDENATVIQVVGTRLEDLSEKATEIGNIVDTITSISDQTNLLALNAAIEAARAGESGRGFAVVADEVRKLAEESGKAANNIKDLILNVQNSAANVVSAMKETTVIVSEQNQMVTNSNEVFEAIAEAVDQMNLKVGLITKAIQEVDQKKNQIVGTVENISSVTEETAAASEEVSASTEVMYGSVERVAESANVLKEASDELQQAISVFKL